MVQMQALIDIPLIVLGVLLAVPAGLFCLENLLAFVYGTGLGHRHEPPARCRLAVVIPAHNEETGIGQTVQSVLAQLRPGDRVLVVADNCTDATADIAREAGAEVTQRTDQELRGKGYALAHALRELADDPPEIVVFVDADCRLRPGCLSSLACQVGRTGAPAQAVYVLGLPEGEHGVRDRVSAFAVRVKNESRPIGLSRLGGKWGACLITGSGFAMPWELADAERFARGDIVEDMTIGLELAVSGTPPRICPGARVDSTLPSGDEAKRTQRERWEHGHLDTILKKGLPILGRGVFTLRPSLVLLGLELAVPPLSLLVMGTLAFAGLTALLALVGLSVWPVALGSAALAMVAIGTGCAWWVVGRTILPARELPGALWYALSKGPIYVGALVRRQTGWVRTARDSEADSTDAKPEETARASDSG